MWSRCIEQYKFSLRKMSWWKKPHMPSISIMYKRKQVEMCAVSLWSQYWATEGLL